MGKQPEYRIVRDIERQLRSRGAFVFKIHGGPTMRVGLPDLIVCWQGRFYGLEVKRPETRDHVSIHQQRVHEQIRLSGGVACVVTSVREALIALGL